jgi:hypothetical protein
MLSAQKAKQRHPTSACKTAQHHDAYNVVILHTVYHGIRVTRLEEALQDFQVKL